MVSPTENAGREAVRPAAQDGQPALEPGAPVAAPPAVRTLGSCDRRGDVARFTIAHLNDLQARYSDRLGDRSRYGFLAGYLQKLKEEVPSTLVLDAGDDYEKGSIAELRSMGETTRRILQAMPIDVRTIGNHDFAYGESEVLRDVTESAQPVLAANVHKVGANDPSPFLPFVRFDVGCVKVGIVGLVATNYGSTDYPTREPFDGVFVHDPHYADILRRQVTEHRDEVDVMIALDHLGSYPDSVLASWVDGVDVFVGGHSEELVSQPRLVRRRDGSRAWIVQAGHWGRTLGRMDLVYDFREQALSVEHYAIVKVDDALPYDEQVGELVQELENEAAPGAHEPLALVSGPVAQGKAMADLVWRAVQNRWGADAMILGSNVFWSGLPAGPVTLQRLYDAVLVQREPTGTSGFSSLYVAQVKGSELLALRSHLIVGPVYAFRGPVVIDPGRTYRLVIEKRALENPSMAFYLARGGTLEMPEARYGGELIDVLEAYARARTAEGRTLD